MKSANKWILNGIGLGAHVLVLIRNGDWNDYLSKAGARGLGESVMNSGMACRAFAKLSELAFVRGEDDFGREVEEQTRKLRESVTKAFDQEWFVRAYTDDGEAVGTVAENRVFLNAQSWATLGKCGSEEQRRTALKHAVRLCHTDIGMMLMSRPYSSPAPSSVSDCPIPAGDGENAGIWPQTVYWMIWALAEEGVLDEAVEEWKCMSLRNRAKLHPDVPSGIINGPDCYSSVCSGTREGWTQTDVWNRMLLLTMNPMVAWQVFAWRKINEG